MLGLWLKGEDIARPGPVFVNAGMKRATEGLFIRVSPVIVPLGDRRGGETDERAALLPLTGASSSDM